LTKYADWDSYFLPNPQEPQEARVLRNLLGATTAKSLAEQELHITLGRVFELEENPIPGQFDFAHHQAIHKHIFKDVYEWAGQPRTVDMGKTHRLWPAAGIVENAPHVYGAISKDNFLIGLRHDSFVDRLAEHWGEVNVFHAFREGNTRSQRVFFGQLCAQAGYRLDGHHLETHYPAFNKARDAAMLTARSDQFATFLSGSVTRM